MYIHFLPEHEACTFFTIQRSPAAEGGDPYMYTSGVFLGKPSVDPKLHTEVNTLFSKVFLKPSLARVSFGNSF